ncbi:MAG: sigma-70 family RNA polymerase sigma factor [Actinomycetota bacterium]|nr:sigma-70 family RNA polymerase sigma factor [Actinomycetota bacterium]
MATRVRRLQEADELLVERTLAGDLGAFETLVQRYQGLVRRLVARVVGEDEAEDVTQDSLLRAFHRLSQFRGAASFRSWLLRIAHNTAVNAVSRRRPEPVEEAEVEAAHAERPASGSSPADRLESRERRERLESKLRTLRPAHRIVLVLRDLEGLSYEEIAEITGTPLGSVKGRLHRARAELIDLLRKNSYDWQLPA